MKISGLKCNFLTKSQISFINLILKFINYVERQFVSQTYFIGIHSTYKLKDG